MSRPLSLPAPSRVGLWVSEATFVGISGLDCVFHTPTLLAKYWPVGCLNTLQYVFVKFSCSKLGMVAHTFNLSTWEAGQADS